MLFPYDFRSPQEKREDETRQIHDNGDCNGAPECGHCQETEDHAEPEHCTIEDFARSSAGKLATTSEYWEAFGKALEKIAGKK